MGGGGAAAGEVACRGGRGDRVRVAELPMAEDSRERRSAAVVFPFLLLINLPLLFSLLPFEDSCMTHSISVLINGNKKNAQPVNCLRC